MALEHRVATRYVLPLREGGSLPAIVDTEHGGQFVVKFRGAGQGPKALVAEVLAAELAEALSLPVPQAAIVRMDEGFGESEPDAEIQDLLRGSTGKNFGLAYLPGALGFDPAADRKLVEGGLAAAIVWFDALISNVDRTPRNANLLVWQGQVWMIDHGASFYFHHGVSDWLGRAQDRFPMIKHHVLLGLAASLEEADARLRPLLTEEVLSGAVGGVPGDWLGDGADGQRTAYVEYLAARINGRPAWLEEAEGARRGS